MAIEFTVKTSTSFRPTRWDFSAQLLPLRFFSAATLLAAVLFLLFRYGRARSASAWSITTCGRSLSVTSTLPSRPPGWPGRNSACSQGTRECCIILLAPKLNHLISGLITNNNPLAMSSAHMCATLLDLMQHVDVLADKMLCCVQGLWRSVRRGGGAGWEQQFFRPAVSEFGAAGLSATSTVELGPGKTR